MIEYKTEGEFGETPEEQDNTELSSVRNKILSYWKSNLTQKQIGLKCRTRHSNVAKVFIEEYGQAALAIRQRWQYSRVKLGKDNPMSGKNGELHHGFIGRSSDGHGYWTVVKPEWYYAPTKRRVPEHHAVYAKSNGLFAIPENNEIHHLDFNPSNNDINNLIMLTKADHIKLHRWLRQNGYEKA